jgi:hypothetical protein
MLRHERHIESDRWEFSSRLLLAALGLKREDAFGLARFLRKNMKLALDHVTPTVEFALLSAEVKKDEMAGTKKQADMVESWG